MALTEAPAAAEIWHEGGLALSEMAVGRRAEMRQTNRIRGLTYPVERYFGTIAGLPEKDNDDPAYIIFKDEGGDHRIVVLGAHTIASKAGPRRVDRYDLTITTSLHPIDD